MTYWRKCATVCAVSQSDTHIGTAEVAVRLGWSIAKVKRQARLGKLPIAFKMPGDTGAYLFRLDEIEQYAREQAA